MKLVFATHNQNKFVEVEQLMPNTIELISLKDIGCLKEIAETGKTLEENAKIKSDFVTKHYGLDCFSDDSGLLVDALYGDPGVYSARYAGPQKNAKDNMDKLLRELKGVENRKARFATVIALNWQGKQQLFKGTVEGQIALNKIGDNGFGYDPVFIPEGYEKTFGQLPAELKNNMSHRAKAISKLLAFLSDSLPHGLKD